RFAGYEPLLLLIAAPFILFSSPYAPLALLLLLIPWVCRWIGRGALTARTPVDIPNIMLLIAVAIAWYASVDLSSSVPPGLRIVFGIVIFYAIVNDVHTKRQIWWAMNVFCLASLVVTALGFLGMEAPWQKLFSLPQVYEKLPHLIERIPEGGGFHPNKVGHTLAVLIPVPAALFLWPPSLVKGKARLLYRLALGLSLLAMVLTLLITQSRMAFLALAVALAAMGLFRKRWFLLGLPAVVILISLGLFYRRVSPDFFVDYMMTNRWDVWRQTMFLIREYPFTGKGFGSLWVVGEFSYPYSLLSTPHNVFSVWVADNWYCHAHNIFLETWAALGIPGILAFVTLLGAFVLTARKVFKNCMDDDLRFYAIGLFCAFVAFVVCGLYDAALYLGTKPSLAFWAMMGLMTAIEFRTRRDQAPEGKKPTWKLTIGIRRLKPLLLVAILPVVLLSPYLAGSFALNLGSLAFHKAMLTADLKASEKTGYLDRAETLYRWAISLWPNRALGHRNLGRVRFSRDEFPAAAADLFQAVQLEPQDLFARFELGQTYEAMGRLDKATAEWTKARADLFFLVRGNAQAEGGNWAEALSDYLIAALINPQNEEVPSRLASASRQLGDEALTVFNHLADVYREQGDLEQAIAVYSKAVELIPKSAALHQQLGDLYRDDGRLEEAVKEYRRALELDPSDDYSRQELERLQTDSAS
ncbi:MAG: tetratricopeptide repeat protein, partial [Anaerolineae bacterium]